MDQQQNVNGFQQHNERSLLLILAIITLLVYGIAFIQELIPISSQRTNTHTTAFAMSGQASNIPAINAKHASLSDLFDERAMISGTFQIQLVEPQDAAPGVPRQFYANLFTPGEAIKLSLDSPSGSSMLDLSVFATERGEVWLELPIDDLTNGNHALILRGVKSGHEIVIPFEVKEE